MLDAHVVQQLSPLRAARGREDLTARGAGDRDGRLSDTAGARVDQHLVRRRDVGQIVQAVPGGRGGGRYRRGVGHRDLRRQGDGQGGRRS